MKLCIKTKQVQNKVLSFFVILMIMDLCIKQAISKQSSKILCNTDDLWFYASKQSNFRTKF